MWPLKKKEPEQNGELDELARGLRELQDRVQSIEIRLELRGIRAEEDKGE